MSDNIDKYFKVIANKDMDDWIPKPKGLYGKIFLRIVNNEGNAVELDVDVLKNDNPKASINSIVSAFYSWKKGDSIKELLESKKLDIKIVKRGDKVGVIKTSKSNIPSPPKGKATLVAKPIK